MSQSGRCKLGIARRSRLGGCRRRRRSAVAVAAPVHTMHCENSLRPLMHGRMRRSLRSLRPDTALRLAAWPPAALTPTFARWTSGANTARSPRAGPASHDHYAPIRCGGCHVADVQRAAGVSAATWRAPRATTARSYQPRPQLDPSPPVRGSQRSVGAPPTKPTPASATAMPSARTRRSIPSAPSRRYVRPHAIAANTWSALPGCGRERVRACAAVRSPAASPDAGSCPRRGVSVAPRACSDR